MKTKKIYIIRHGETDYNLKNCVQGRGIDSSINTKGEKQSNLFYQTYKNIQFDKIYTSSLKRTQQSVQSFITDKIPYEELSGLDEISWGKHEGQPYDPEMHQIYLNTVQRWTSGVLDARVGGGETPIEVVLRQKNAMEYIMGKKDEEVILIATHGRAMRILMSWLLRYPLTHMDVFEHANLCLYQLEFQSETFKIIKYADVSHLKE